MSSDNHYDVIIIGTGAGGGTLAYRLAPSGKRILLLERGDYVRREKENWSSRAINLEARYNTKELWRDKKNEELHPHTNYYVGGNTKFYGAALFRLRKEDFGEIRHSGGVSPAWPINYEDLEPYYAEAERVYNVHGRRGEDPTEPPAAGPYPYPAVSHEPRIAALSDHFAAQGLKPFHVPLGIMLNEQDPNKSRCIRCNTCDGFPCLVHAKSDAQVCCVDPALQHANVTLLTGALVRRLETSPSGRDVSGVVVERNGEAETFSGDIVVVSGGAINSAALLLRSANDSPPSRAGQRIGRGGPALHGPYQQRGDGIVSLSESHGVPENARGERLLSRLAGLAVPDGAHLFCRETRPGRTSRGRAGYRSGIHAGNDGETLARFLAYFRGPSRCEQSRHPQSAG